MNGLIFIRTVIYSCIVLFSLHSCGLHYTPDLSIEEYTQQRRLVLESQLKKDYETLGKSYFPITYGDPVAVKPISYKRLDSLFQKKYTATNLGQSTAEIDLLIEAQQQVIQNDTNKVRYMETHWFELIQDSLHEFITAECILNKQNELDEMRILDYFTTGKKNTTFARKYCKEEAFVYYTNEYKNSNSPQPYTRFSNTSELNFYSLMKEKSTSLFGEEKEQFMEHVFKLMTISQIIQSLETTRLLTYITQDELLKTNPGINLNEIKFDISKQNDEMEMPYIEVLVRKSPDKTAFKVFKYDAWLQEIKP